MAYHCHLQAPLPTPAPPHKPIKILMERNSFQIRQFANKLIIVFTEVDLLVQSKNYIFLEANGHYKKFTYNIVSNHISFVF